MPSDQPRAESDKRQRLSSLFLRSYTSWPAKSNRSSRGEREFIVVRAAETMLTFGAKPNR